MRIWSILLIKSDLKSCIHVSKREKGRDLTQACDKNPYTHRTIQKATWQHKNATKNFDYTTIADRLRTVSWSSSSHPTGVVKPVYERSTFPLTAKVVQSIVHGTEERLFKIHTDFFKDGYMLKDNQEFIIKKKMK